MIQQIPNQSQANKGGVFDKIKGKKSLVLTIFIVIFAIICFSFSIFAMSAAVTYFSYMFGLTNQLVAKAYLKQYYSWYMAITYMTIFGMVICIANTAVHFTQFTQKQRILWIHVVFYLFMFICGIVALAGKSEYNANMLAKMQSQNCLAIDFECNLSIRYVIYKGQVTSYFIGYCICFFAYAALYHYSSYVERVSRQQAQPKLEALKQQTFAEEKQKNLSFVSN